MRYFISKLKYALFTLFGVITVVFFLFHVIPGDPARMMLDKNENARQLALVKKKYGFDKPITTQYVYYLNDLSPISLHSTNPQAYTYLDKNKYHFIKITTLQNKTLVLKTPYLRTSFQKNDKKVTQVIAQTLPNTVVLALCAMTITIFLGIPLGIIAALYKNTWIDKSINLLSILGISTPSFFSAILFAWIFGFVLHTYTHLNMTGSLYEVDDFGEGTFMQWKNTILPAIVLGIRPIAVVVPLMRNALWDVMQLDYIKTARAKGLSTLTIIRKHALKNALNPVVTVLSGSFASMLAGAVFIEYIFGWNGLGKEIVEALNNLDLPVIMGAVITIATTFITINIVVDLIYAYLDPKIRG